MTARSLALEIPIPLLEWLPGETFFSLCSRHHRLSGFTASAHTTQALFGHSRSGSQHDFPSRLDEFVSRTEGIYGSASQIARERTALRYYTSFLAPRNTEDAVASMRSPSVAHLKYRLGILTSRFGANHPLKACPRCVDESIRTHGWAAWFERHQRPGIWMCRRHGQPLLTFEMKANGVNRFTWQLPSAALLRCDWTDCADAAHRAQLGLTKFIHEALDAEQVDGWLRTATVQEVSRRRLDELGLITPSGNIRLKEISGGFAAHCNLLRAVPELAALPATMEEAAAEVGRLLRPLRSSTHPIRLLVLTHWLFPEASALRLAVEAMRGAAPSNDQLSSVAISVPDLVHEQFLGLLAGGASVRQASDATGITANTGIAWAATAGVKVVPRPKVLKPEVRSQLIALLKNGLDRAEAATAVGVSPGTVDRLFQKEPTLHASWHEARMLKAQRQARAAWNQATSADGIKLARALEPAAYAWLYRHDRIWLDDSCSALRSPRAPSMPHVMWDARDADIASKVREALPKLAKTQSGKVRLWQVCQAVPELKAKLSKLYRLPLTRWTLEQAMPMRKQLTETDELPFP